jgi:hypothetical protein
VVGIDGVSDQTASDFPAVAQFVIDEVFKLSRGSCADYLVLHWLAASEANLVRACPKPTQFEAQPFALSIANMRAKTQSTTLSFSDVPHDAVIRVYKEAGDTRLEMHKHTGTAPISF